MDIIKLSGNEMREALFDKLLLEEAYQKIYIRCLIFMDLKPLLLHLLRYISFFSDNLKEILFRVSLLL